jgi:Zn-dependent protease
MKAQIKLFKVFGIQIGLHYSWLLIALLVIFSLAGQFSATNPQSGSNVIWGLAILTAILFFAAIVVHELSHAAVAKARGLPVRSITLFALGGVAQIDKEASDAKTEFWMGIVGLRQCCLPSPRARHARRRYRKGSSFLVRIRETGR